MRQPPAAETDLATVQRLATRICASTAHHAPWTATTSRRAHRLLPLPPTPRPTSPPIPQGYTTSVAAVPSNCIIVMLAFGLACTVAGLRTFGQERTTYLKRESYAGLQTGTYMLARMLYDSVTIMVAYPVIYLAFYYIMTLFTTPFGKFYLALLCVSWYTFGVGYLFSVLLSPTNALLASLSFTLITGGVINGVSPSVARAKESNLLVAVLQYISYTRCC